MLILVIISIFCAFKSAAIWDRKGGNAYHGFFIGAIFGIFGLAFCYIASPSRRRY